MYHTPWAKGASSLSSDRIRPKPAADTKAKGRAKGRHEELPKSMDVRKLESLLTALQESVGKAKIEKDPKGGCFCLARTHDLSPYVKLCTSCGFILCVINQPNFACASCSAPLQTSSASTALITRLESEIASALAREAEARERLAEEAQKAAGAFPMLHVAGSSPSLTTPIVVPPQIQAHKVLSLNSKTKKVTVSSYSPASSRPASRGPPEMEVDREPDRVPPPLGAEVVCAKRRVGVERPWENLRGEPVIYVPPARVDVGTQGSTEGGKGNQRRTAKGKRS